MDINLSLYSIFATQLFINKDMFINKKEETSALIVTRNLLAFMREVRQYVRSIVFKCILSTLDNNNSVLANNEKRKTKNTGKNYTGVTCKAMRMYLKEIITLMHLSVAFFWRQFCILPINH